MNDIEVEHQSDFVPESDKYLKWLRQSRHREPPSRTEDTEPNAGCLLTSIRI